MGELTIRLEDANNSPHGEKFIGNRRRLATCTGVSLLGPDRLVATSLVAQRMYLIRFDVASGGHAVECVIPTRAGGQDVCTDLVDFDGADRLVTSNCEQGSVSLYRLDGRTLRHERDLVIPEPRAFSHGVKFTPSGTAICTATPNRARFLYFLARDDGRLLYKFGDGDWKVKDCAFVSDGVMLVLYAGSAVTATATETASDSKLAIVSLDLAGSRHEVLHELTFPGHTDSCAFAEGRGFVTNGTRDQVMVFAVAEGQLALTATLDGFSIPHGIDVDPQAGLLAVTNYGDNSVTIRHLADCGM